MNQCRVLFLQGIVNAAQLLAAEFGIDGTTIRNKFEMPDIFENPQTKIMTFGQTDLDMQVMAEEVMQVMAFGRQRSLRFSKNLMHYN
ncbi:hypothetical protein KIN20_003166 [Parelaphostrongylus tenuis]|uniref:Uncharacterized protein n=1 Tax=Parelaphostrongylus tenuis TaxID=148309 RepID=A0AAD5MPJ3_PARTN|nr:hypothetical protein KIN20_003166 [Parelaphostrongylus tenuis]